MKIEFLSCSISFPTVELIRDDKEKKSGLFICAVFLRIFIWFKKIHN